MEDSNSALNEKDEAALEEIRTLLEQFVLGKLCSQVSAEPENPVLIQIVDLLNIFADNFNEAVSFVNLVSRGNLDTDPPNRHNYIAAPFKELHSRLSSLVWTIDQLAQGKVVERIDFMGEVSDSVNKLIDNFTGMDESFLEAGTAEIPDNMNSWKFHQIFLAFNHLQIMLLFIDENDRIIFSNSNATEVFKAAKSLKSPGIPVELYDLVSVIEYKNSENLVFPYIQEVFTQSNKMWYRIKTDQLTFPNKKVYLLHAIENISEWKEHQEELTLFATTDSLTGVYNRKIGLQTLQNMLEGKHEEDCNCAAFLDIDNLRIINNSYGHAEGDYAIKTISEVITHSVREADIVSRFGGDEFLIVFRSCDVPTAELILKRIVNQLDTISDEHGKSFKLSVSYGITNISNEGINTVKDIIMLTDKKMYEQKAKKKSESGTYTFT